MTSLERERIWAMIRVLSHSKRPLKLSSPPPKVSILTLSHVKTEALSLLSLLPHLFLYTQRCWHWAPGHTGANTLQTKCGKPRSSPGVKFVYKSLNFVASDSLCLQLWKFPHKGHYTIHRLQLSPSSERLKQVFLNSFHFALVKQWKKN